MHLHYRPYNRIHKLYYVETHSHSLINLGSTGYAGLGLSVTQTVALKVMVDTFHEE